MTDCGSAFKRFIFPNATNCIRKLGLSVQRVPFSLFLSIECQEGLAGILQTQKPPSLPEWWKRLFRGGRFPARLLYARSYTSRILSIDPRLLICQITHIHEKDALVSDLDVAWAPVPTECTACHGRRRG